MAVTQASKDLRTRFHWLPDSPRFLNAESHDVDAVRAGRLLLVIIGAAILGATPFLSPDVRSWTVAAIVVAALGSGVLLTYVVPWSRLSPRCTMLFPIGAELALLALGLGQHPTFAPLTACSVLCFAFVGITQPPATSSVLAPLAGAALLASYGEVSGPVLVRLVIAVAVWLVLAELLSSLTMLRSRLTAALQSAVVTDSLTGVANRRHLDRRLSDARVGDVVVVCDLDHFRDVNETRGHAGGDAVLSLFGLALQASLRQGDYCARFGGEEFAVILPGTTLPDAESVLARVREHWALLEPGVTFSAGLSRVEGDMTALEVFARADTALYGAKNAGRNTDRTSGETRTSEASELCAT